MGREEFREPRRGNGKKERGGEEREERKDWSGGERERDNMAKSNGGYFVREKERQ